LVEIRTDTTDQDLLAIDGIMSFPKPLELIHCLDADLVVLRKLSFIEYLNIVCQQCQLYVGSSAWLRRHVLPPLNQDTRHHYIVTRLASLDKSIFEYDAHGAWDEAGLQRLEELL